MLYLVRPDRYPWDETCPMPTQMTNERRDERIRELDREILLRLCERDRLLLERGND